MATVSFSLDKALKEKAETYFQSIGMSLPEYLQSCVRNSVIDHEPNEETIAALAECEEMLKNPDDYPAYHSMKEFIAALESDEE